MNEIQLTDHLVAHIGAEGTCGRYQAKIYEDGNFRDFLMSKNTMMAIVQAFGLLVFLGLTVWQLNHLTWSITDYRVRISSNLEKGAHVEQSEK